MINIIGFCGVLKLKTWIDDESGAVTVDWVVLVAGLVGVALAVSTSVRGGAVNLADTVSSEVQAIEPGNV